MYRETGKPRKLGWLEAQQGSKAVGKGMLTSVEVLIPSVGVSGGRLCRGNEFRRVEPSVMRLVPCKKSHRGASFSILPSTTRVHNEKTGSCN